MQRTRLARVAIGYPLNKGSNLIYIGCETCEGVHKNVHVKALGRARVFTFT